MTVELSLFLAVHEDLRIINKSESTVIHYRALSTILGIKVIFSSQRGNGGKWINENSASSAQFLTQLQSSVVALQIVTFSRMK
jgi:hypothetical protein